MFGLPWHWVEKWWWDGKVFVMGNEDGGGI